MGPFFQAAAAVLLAAVLALAMGKSRQELGLLLTIAVSAMLMLMAMRYLEPVTELLESLQATAELQGGMLEILLKATGIGLVAEIAAMVSTDAGNGSVGKAMQLLGSAVILWMSVPVFSALLDLIGQILGAV